MTRIFYALIAVFFLSAFSAPNIFDGNCEIKSLDEFINMPEPIKINNKKDSRPGNCTFPVHIKPDEAAYFIEAKNPIIIDIRTPEEYKAERLENVRMNIDYYAPDFKEKLSKLDKNAKYLLYCRTGHRTGIALHIMKNMGFTDIHDIDGGITAWKEAGYPTVKGR